MATKVSISHTVTIYVDGVDEPLVLTGANAEGAVYSFTHGLPIEFTNEGCLELIHPSSICMITDCISSSSETVEDPTCVEDEGGGK